MNLIKKGENSKRVIIVQSLLNVILGTNLQTDGIFGEKTYNTVMAYQSSRSLLVDGVIGQETINSLIEVTKTILNN